MSELQWVPSDFSMQDLLRLLDCLITLNDKHLTQQVAVAMKRINTPPMIYKESQS